MSSYSPDIPTSFDPALLHSELEFPQDAPPSFSYSDQIEALQQCIVDDTTKKTREGIVIQHRAWKISDVFRSEGEVTIDTPVKRSRQAPAKRFATASSTEEVILPSSPPLYKMPLISSPVAYPPSSSMPQAPSPKKRKRQEEAREPMKDLPNHNASHKRGAFVDDSDDEEELAALKEHALKRRAVSSIKDLPELPESFTEYTPPASQDEYANPESIPVDELDKYSFKSASQSPVKRPHTAKEPTSAQPMSGTIARDSSGNAIYIPKRINKDAPTYEQLIAARSVAVPGKARTSYYGLNIHELMDEAKALDLEKAVNKAQTPKEPPHQSIEQSASKGSKSNRTLMWTEKYRAKKFTDLVGDERTHRSVLRWLKAWDPIVFPGVAKVKSKGAKKHFEEEEQRHRKVLLLTGPPGLGKTTLAHVCARQAGYEVAYETWSVQRMYEVSTQLQ
ncbi:hypothetical protein LEMA_P083040.1 [Plenodomus lingam JN3]|uniref:ATPase AAA-type core domain-containing protein n=1 Tax=Leptosphaeria maculans (strain JN3 / isolate v23.1.3 / race Av1-4-5-6-7-8) TaxID=985895 RepID=E5A620_LEPMJ|nr:hypothetical protein LEMA_P083040.1 [Plenodomus lingam JN3]CBX99065.1 hypothetical protein LEMA_P083040.1 [Plenodomus lingam JN3]